MLTYYQKKRMVAKLKRVRNHIKYNELGYGLGIWHALVAIDSVIMMHLNEPNAVRRTKPLPPRIWREKRKS